MPFRRVFQIPSKDASGFNLVMPYFVVEGKGIRETVVSMPGVARLSVDLLVAEVAAAYELGVPAIILFGIPSRKDPAGSGAYALKGVVQEAVRAVKRQVPDMYVITDVCLCEYTSHGHCCVVKENACDCKSASGFIDLKKTVELLAQTALSHAEAGADMVAPSAMMKGQVAAIRKLLDKSGHKKIPVMAYSAKFASAYYGPFRDAADSAPQFGDRRAYQLDPLAVKQAMAEVAADIREGAAIVMVKPALAYLDIIRQVREKYKTPLAAYNVSAEYSMVKAAAFNGWIDEKRVVLETLTGIKRAGADIIISYHACDVMRWLKAGDE